MRSLPVAGVWAVLVSPAALAKASALSPALGEAAARDLVAGAAEGSPALRREGFTVSRLDRTAFDFNILFGILILELKKAAHALTELS